MSEPKSIISISKEFSDYLKERRGELSFEDYLRECLGLPLLYAKFNFSSMKFGDSREYKVTSEEFRVRIFRAYSISRSKGINLSIEWCDSGAVITRIPEVI